LREGRMASVTPVFLFIEQAIKSWTAEAFIKI
jgi:hypothetical protein